MVCIRECPTCKWEVCLFCCWVLLVKTNWFFVLFKFSYLSSVWFYPLWTVWYWNLQLLLQDCFFLLFLQFLLHILWRFVIMSVNICVIFLLYWTFYVNIIFTGRKWRNGSIDPIYYKSQIRKWTKIYVTEKSHFYMWMLAPVLSLS